MINSTINELKAISSEKYKQNVVKMGIPLESTIGVPTPELRKIARKIPKELRTKEIVKAFWVTGYHEGKIIGTLLMTKLNYSKQEINWYMSKIESWDLCDLFCKSVLINSKDFDYFISSWITDSRMYYKRAAFTLIASMSTHSAISLNEVKNYLTFISNNSDDDRLLIKKAISWALRELGKIDEQAKEASITVANELLLSGDKNKIWIAKDALKELELLIRVEGRSRLISSKSKMGQEASSTS